MNTPDLIARVQQAVKDDSFTEAEILSRLNDALQAVAFEFCLPELEADDEIAFTAGGDAFAPLPDDYHHDLWHIDPLTFTDRILVMGSHKSLQRIYAVNEQGGHIYHAAVDGLTLHVRPLPTQDQTVKIYYYRKPETLTVDVVVGHFVLDSLPANGTLYLNDVELLVGDTIPATDNSAILTFVPEEGWSGTTDFQYTAVEADALSESDSATATITVEQVSGPPNTANTSWTGFENSEGIDVGLGGTDIDGTIDHFVLVSLPGNGTLYLDSVELLVGDSVPATDNGAVVVFIPAADWSGSTGFEYAAVDDEGLTDDTPATATITVIAEEFSTSVSVVLSGGYIGSPSIPEGIPPHLHTILSDKVASELFDIIEDGIDGNKANTNRYERRYMNGLVSLQQYANRAPRLTPYIRRRVQDF